MEPNVMTLSLFITFYHFYHFSSKLLPYLSRPFITFITFYHFLPLFIKVLISSRPTFITFITFSPLFDLKSTFYRDTNLSLCTSTTSNSVMFNPSRRENGNRTSIGTRSGVVLQIGGSIKYLSTITGNGENTTSVCCIGTSVHSTCHFSDPIWNMNKLVSLNNNVWNDAYWSKLSWNSRHTLPTFRSNTPPPTPPPPTLQLHHFWPPTSNFITFNLHSWYWYCNECMMIWTNSTDAHQCCADYTMSSIRTSDM